jgi:hypothetical protein
MEKYEFVWEWCMLCQAWYIRCPKCGNNLCNGHFACEICSLASQYMDLAYKHDDVPSEEGMPKLPDNWFEKL